MLKFVHAQIRTCSNSYMLKFVHAQIPLVLCLGVPPAAYPPIVIVRHTLCSSETLTLFYSELVVRNADSLFCVRQKRWRSILPVYLLMHIFVYSASAEVKTALAQAFWMGFISFCGRIAEAYNQSSGLKAVLIFVLLLLLFYSESSIDFNMQTQQDSQKSPDAGEEEGVGVRNEIFKDEN